MPNPNAKIANQFRVARLVDFSKGENRKNSEWKQGEGYLNRARDFYLSNDGSLIMRRGTVRANETSLGAGPQRGSYRTHDSDGVGHFLVYHGTSIYESDDDGQSFTAVVTGLSALTTTKMWYLQWEEFVYVSDGIDAHRKQNVDTKVWTPWGSATPSAAPTAAVGAAGALTGDYTFRYTYVSTSGVESNGSPVSNTVTLTADNANLTGITVGPSGTASRKVYGFKTAVSTVYQLIATIADNTTTTYTVTTDQDAWTTELESDNSPPPVSAWISALHKNRIWMIGDRSNRLYFSKTLEPEVFPTTNFLEVSFDHGDYGTALFAMGDVLFVFGHDSVHYVIGNDEFSFRPVRTYATTGCPGPWAVDKVQIPGSESTLLYLSRNGIFAIYGREAQAISEPEEPFFTNLPEVT